MEWYGILSVILGGVGGASGLVSLYTAKAKKSTIEIENFKKLFDEAQEERKNIREMHNDYKIEMDEKINKLEKKVESMDARLSRKQRAVNAAYRCRFPDKIADCPVLQTLDEES